MEVDKIEKENICVVQRLAAQPDCVRGLRIKTDGGERRKRAGSDCHGCSDGKGGIFRSREHRGTHGSTFHGTGECEPAHRPPTLTDGAIGKRPVAVMVNNVDAALPQYGISAADLIFELPVEYDLTRLMAVYGDYTQVPDVCSVRSCRYYYPILAVGFDAVYVHWGIDPTIATETINSMEIDHFDADYYGTGKYFGRDKDRINAGYAWEHTGMFYGTKVPEMLEDSNVRTDLKEDKMGTAFKFVEMDKNAAPSGEDAKNIRVDFGANYSTFSYDADRHVYMKNYQNKPHMDCKTNEQLQFENVIVLEADISLRPNDVDGHKLINWEGGENAKGYYISEGKMVPITWSKAGMYDPLKFFDANGNELQLNRGKSYIAFTYAGNCKVEG